MTPSLRLLLMRLTAVLFALVFVVAYWIATHRDRFDMAPRTSTGPLPVATTQITNQRKDFLPVWSPDGKAIAFSRSYNPAKNKSLWILGVEVRVIWLADNREAVLLSRKEAPKGCDPAKSIIYPRWVSDSKRLLCAIHYKDKNKNILSPSGIWQVWLNGATNKYSAGTDPSLESYPDIVLPSPVGLAYLYMSYNSEKDCTVLMLGDLESRKQRILCEGPLSFYDWTPDGKRVIVVRYDNYTNNYGGTLWIYSAADGQGRQLSAERVKSVCKLCSSPDGKSFAYTTYEEDESFHYTKSTYISPLHAFKPRLLYAGKHEIVSWASPTALCLYSPRGEGESSAAYSIVDLRGKVLKTILADDFGSPSFAPDGKHYVYAREGNLYIDMLE